MGAILFRIVLLAGGLGLGETGLTSLAAGDPASPIQLGLSVALLFAGSAGFIVPLLGDRRDEVSFDD